MAKRRPPPGLLSRLGHELRSARGRLLIRCGAAALVFLAIGLVMRQARAQAYALPRYRLAPDDVEVVRLPPWLGSAKRLFGPEALRAFTRDFAVSVYDPAAEGLVAERIERHPMVRRVRQVRVRYPARAEVSVALREPVAYIELKNKKGRKLRYLLADDGALLPVQPYRAYLQLRTTPLPRVTGIRTKPPLRLGRRGPRLAEGEIWEDDDERVAEAVRAARLAERIFEEFSGRVIVRSIDVSHFYPDGRDRDGVAGEVRLRVSCPPPRRGSKRVLRTIEWGRTERARHQVVGEDDLETKLGRLRAQLTRPVVPGRIDVRWWDSATGP